VAELGERVAFAGARAKRCPYADLLPAREVTAARVGVAYEAGAPLEVVVDGLAGAGVLDSDGVWLDVLALSPAYSSGEGPLALVAEAVSASVEQVAIVRVGEGGACTVDLHDASSQGAAQDFVGTLVRARHEAGGARPGLAAVRSHKEEGPFDIEVVPFEAFKELGRFPRSHERVTVPLSSLRVDGHRPLVIFLSHRWLLPYWPGSKLSYPPLEWYGKLGIDPKRQGYGHPDDEHHRKAALVIEAVDKLMGMVPDRRRVCLWADYACIDQDAGDRAAELLNNNMLRIIGECDVVLTPVVDDMCDKWEMGDLNDVLNAYGSDAWKVYWSRGWCRLEAFSASNIPVPRHERGEGLPPCLIKPIVEEKLRPHYIYGSKESEKDWGPMMLPPLRNSYFARYHPAKGDLTSEADRAVVERYVEWLEAAMPAAAQARYEGETMSDDSGTPHGRGCQWFESGDRCEGDFKEGFMHGRGQWHFVSGHHYDGEFLDGKRHGRGKWTYSSGNWYEGEWKEGSRHGKGKSYYANGVLAYEGGYEGDQRNGQGTCYGKDGGRRKVGEFWNGKMHGRGTSFREDGSLEYEGEWRDDNRHGWGKEYGLDGSTVSREGEWVKGALTGSQN